MKPAPNEGRSTPTPSSKNESVAAPAEAAPSTSGTSPLAGGTLPAHREEALISPDHLRVMVFSDATPGRNGVGTFYDDLAAMLEPLVGAIRVIAPPAESDSAHRGLSMPMPGDPTQRLRIPWAPQVWRQVRWTRPHVILSATPGAYGVLGLLMAARLRAGGALCYHTEIPKLAETYWSGPLARIPCAMLTWWDRFLVRRSPAVLAPNAELAEALARLGRADAHVMGTLAPRDFVDTPVADPPRSIGSVAFIGRLAAEKRVEQVLDAAAALPDVRFHIVGDGPEREMVDGRAASLPNVELTRWVTRPDVMGVMDESDLVVLPSRHETFGSAAFEAMARGRLALVSPQCGITDWPVLEPGLLVMHEGETLSDAVHRVRTLDAERLARMAESARAAALELHRRSVDGWLELLQTLAREPTR